MLLMKINLIIYLTRVKINIITPTAQTSRCLNETYAHVSEINIIFSSIRAICDSENYL